MSGKILAMYIRLSLEDGDLKSSADKLESNSVSNQRKLLLDYYKTHADLRSYEIIEFCDDGYTGTNFKRPNFTRMMELVRLGEIHCILVKDLSRFGREFLEVGAYLELILPLFGTRFISANDQFDSNDYIGTTGGMELALHNLINGMYSKDLSVKIRSAVKTRNRRGLYWGGPSFYGYKLDPNNKHRLVKDDAVSQYISTIFDLCISGLSTMQIAKKLNEMGIPSPAAYKKQSGVIYNGRIMEDGPAWIGGTVRHILVDERYTGKMVSGTREMVGIHTNKMRSLPEDEWIVVDGTHEAIVTQETFLAAKQALQSRIRTVNTNTSGNRAHNLFVCGYCGRKLQKSNGKQVNLYCIQPRSKDCPECESIWEDMLTLRGNALAVIQSYANMLLDRASIIRRNGGPKQAQLQRELSAAEARLAVISSSKSILYEEYQAGKRTKESFLKTQSDNRKESDALSQRIASLKEDMDTWRLASRTMFQNEQHAQEIQALAEYRPEVICRLVEQIRVFSGGRIEIALKNTDSFGSFGQKEMLPINGNNNILSLT